MTIENLIKAIKNYSGQQKTDALAALWEELRGLIQMKAAAALQTRPDLVDDLTQELFIAMTRAAEAFDPSAGCSFLTFYLQYYFPRAYRLVRYGSITPGAEKRPDNIAVSLSDPAAADEEDERTIADIIADPEALAAFDQIENEDLDRFTAARIRDSIRAEPDYQSRAILWSLYHNDGQTSKEIAESLGMSYAYYMGKRDKALKRIRQRILNRITPEERIDYLAEIMNARSLTRGHNLRRFRENVNTSEVERLAIKAADLSMAAYGVKPPGSSRKRKQKTEREE